LAKPTAEELKAEIELQLSERRFILETVNTAAALLQVPLVTAVVWFYISRSNPVMGALNKAILTAELAPIVGDIRFPEGVLLGAAMESTEDLMNILQGYGLGSAKEWFAAGEEGVQDAGDILGDLIVKSTAPYVTCDRLRDDKIATEEKIKKSSVGAERMFWMANLHYIRNLMEAKKCDEFGAVRV